MSSAAVPKRRLYVKLQLKLAIVFSFLFGVILALVFVWFYFYATGVVKNRISQSMEEDLTAGAAGINGDTLTALYNQAQPKLYSDRGDSDPSNDVYYTDDPRYWQIATWLHTVRKLDPNAQTWVFVRADATTDPTGFYYVVDGLALDNPLPVGTVNFKQHGTTADGRMFIGLDHTAIFLNDIYERNGQWWVSGYSPIKDSSGKVVAALGVHYEADYIIEVENQVLEVTIPAFIITSLVVFTLVYLAARVLSRPIVQLTAIAGHIGEGNYASNISQVRTLPLPDEIDTLAEVFQEMSDKIAHREQHLKQQVADLQIQIDHGKRDEQVKEIVENDFFQSLQSKASEMRSRRQDAPPETPE